MNIRGGLALISKSLFSYTASAGFFWTLAISWMMGPLIYLFVWQAAASQGPINGFGQGEFVLYYLALMIVNQLTYPCSHWTIGGSIHSGHLSYWLLRPVPVIYEAIASDIALKIVCSPFVLFLTIGLAIGWRFVPSVEPGAFWVFLVLLLLAQVLRFMLAYTLSLLALWTQRIDALLKVNDTLVFLLSGQVVPTPLLPETLRQVAEVLPYRYMLGFPVEYLMGRVGPSELVGGVVIQLVWILVVSISHSVVWQLGMKKYSSVGG